MALPDPSQLYSQVEDQLRGYGNAQQAALQQSYQNSVGQGMQSLASSGLAGTSIAPSMRMGYKKQYQQALNSLSGQLTQQHMSADQTFGMGGIGLQQAQQGLDQSKQQIANQMKLGLGNLAVAQGNLGVSGQYANIAAQDSASRQQQMAYQQSGISQSSLGPTPYQSALGSLHSAYSFA